MRKIISSLTVLAVMLCSVAIANAGVSAVGVDTTAKAQWRTAAEFENDNQYGTEGFVIYGLNVGDGSYVTPFDTATTNVQNEVLLPSYIKSVIAQNPTNMWSGNGNFGTIQNPVTEAIENVPVLAGVVDNTFVITRANADFRLVLLLADGDSSQVEYKTTVSDGTDSVSQTHKHTENGLVYHVYNITAGDSDITVKVDADNDNFNLTGMAFDAAAPRAAYIAPEKDAVDVVVAAPVEFSWETAVDPNEPGTANPDVTGHFFYLGESLEDMVLQGSKLAVGTTSTTVTLAKDKTYFWRIDEELENGGSAAVITGLAWSFETELTLPQIDVQPQDVVKGAGADVNFTVEATDPLGGTLTYQWFRDPNAVVEGDDIELENVDNFSGVDTANLTITNISEDVEGLYYCVVSNGQTIETDKASLRAGVLVGHWPFDSNLNDVVSGNAGSYTGTGTPSYPAGKIGTASVDFPADTDTDADYHANDYAVSVPTTALKENSFTITYWEQARATVAAPSGWESTVAAGVISGFEIMELSRYEGGLRWFVGFGTPRVDVAGVSGQATREQWIMEALSYDAEAKTWTWYIDGVAYMTANAVDFTGFAGEPLFVGNCRSGSQPFNGQIDDLKLYDYSLNAVEIATAYTDVAGGWVCTEFPANDFNKDCVVDVQDLAMMAGVWLECGLIPASACN
ncbi:MAG: immunoglobulin domain-containing protein [Phycisphaerae bacterium]|nr:immunoglobulin domain-containing protein [Phycisphaerae bacterium]